MVRSYAWARAKPLPPYTGLFRDQLCIKLVLEQGALLL